jgi:hypothetical protein
MTPVEPIATTEVLTVSCALIVTRRDHTEVLLVGRGKEHCLPSIEIPRRQRPAPHINDNLKQVWGVESVCLFAAGASSDPDAEGTRRCYVVEALGSGPASRHDSTWTSVRDLRSGCLLGVNDTRTLISALKKAEAFEADKAASHFVRSGWIEDVTAWVREQVSRRGWLLGERWTQYAMGPDFALIRFDTTGPAVWFKAAGGTGTAEYAISLALAGLESPYLPEHLGESAEWKSWLMADAPGCRLAESERLQAWTTAATSLAALQIDSLNFAERLIAAGCHDCRTPQLEEMIDPFIAEVADLMAAQPQSPPRILTDKELGTVAAFLRDGCALLDTLPILPCLGHGDLNPGNVIVDGKKAMFLDWAAGMVGHPFFSCEYLLALFRRLHPRRAGWTDAIRSAYVTPWRRICPAEAVEQSLAWTPLLAPYAWALRLWIAEPRSAGTDAYTARLLRSVARRIHSETALLEQRVSESNLEERR